MNTATQECKDIPLKEYVNRKDREPVCSYSCRQSAKAVLEDQIYRVRQQLRGLEMLRDTLPTQLSPEQDEVLWSFFCTKW